MADDSVPLTTKTCTKCGETKPLEAFSLAGSHRYPARRRARCKQCSSQAFQGWYNEHKAANNAATKAYRKAHPEKMGLLYKAYRDTHQKERSLYQQSWEAAHREERSLYNKAYYAIRRDKQLRYNRLYYAAHRATRRKASRLYAVHHKTQRALLQNARRTRRKHLPTTFTSEQEQFARQYFHYACAICEREASFTSVIGLDHWIPLASADCPGTVATNMIPLCHGEHGCNNSKGKKDPIFWLKEHFGTRKAAQILKKIAAYFEAVRLRHQPS